MRIAAVVALMLSLLAPTAVRATAEAPVERGRYLVEVLAACGNCHTPKGPDGLPLADRNMAGGFAIEDVFGAAIASNITPDPETGIGRWSDEEIARAIREGKGRDGRTLGPPMAFEFYRRISDADVTAMVAYLRTVPPVRNAVPPSRYVVPLPASYGPPLGSVPEVPSSDRVRYGEYLAGPIAHCMDCHTPRRVDWSLDVQRLGAGGFRFLGPWGTSYAANITPDKDTGIGAWGDGRIIASIYGARHDGGRVLPPMPTPYFAGRIRPADLEAIIAYLRSLPPVANRVPAPLPPGRRS